MPVDAAKKKQYRDADYSRNKERLLAMSAIRNVLAGKTAQQKTREKYGWTIGDINLIRGHDATFRATLVHGLKLDAKKLEALYGRHGRLPPLPDDLVRIHVPPVRDPAPFKQCLESVPAAGTGSISWAAIKDFWHGDVEKHEMGSSRARMVQSGDKMVPDKYKPSTRTQMRRTFEMLRVHDKAEPGDDAMPLLRRAEDVMAFFMAFYAKTPEKIAADVTREGSAHAVAGRDDGEEVSSGGRRQAQAGREDAAMVSRPAAENRRARHQAPELKGVTGTYANRLGHIISTYESWGLFREALGSDALSKYRGGFGVGQTAFMAAKEVAKETARNRVKAPEYAVPHYTLLLSYLPRIREKLGGPTPTYLAAYLQVKLLGLRDNLGGVRVYKDGEGHVYRNGDGEDKRDAWYNRKTGRLYISWFKTNQSKYGTPYDFYLEGEVRAEVEASLDMYKRDWLVGVKRTNGETGKPKPAGPTVQEAFKAVGFRYRIMGPKGLRWVHPGPLDIRHSQVTRQHELYDRRGMTADQIAAKIALIFNHSKDMNQDYLRLTFRTLEEGAKGDPEKQKQGTTAPLPAISEEGSGDSTQAPKKPKAKPKAKPAPQPEPAAPARVSRSGRKVKDNSRYRNN